jgi:hypothetical protein
LGSLNDCRLTLYSGEGLPRTMVTFYPIATVANGGGSRSFRLSNFRQPLQAPKATGSKKRRTPKRLFLLGGAVCPSANVRVLSSAVAVKTSTKRGALSTKRWVARLAANMRGS